MYAACCCSRFRRRPSPKRRTFSNVPPTVEDMCERVPGGACALIDSSYTITTLRGMGSHRLPTLIVLPLTLLLLLAATSAAQALVKPGRTTVRDGQVRLVALDQAPLAFAVGRSEHDCDHLELSNIATHGLWRFGKPGACTNLGSTGAGISAIGVSG